MSQNKFRLVAPFKPTGDPALELASTRVKRRGRHATLRRSVQGKSNLHL